MSAPLVSVVTPFYDIAEHLDECMASVRVQTYRNFEYLVVDNCSSDGSSEIAQRHARSDPRIRYLRNDTHLAQVPNYNHAVAQIASGSRYVKVVQADDALMPRCLEEMVAAAEAHPTAAVISSYRIKGCGLLGAGLAHDQTLVSGREACRALFTKGVFLAGSPTTVMFRADVVRARQPFWAEGRLHEDTEAVFEILRDHDLAFVHQVLSFSRVEASSITGRVRDYGPDLLDSLILIKRYGRDCLSAEEYEHLVRWHERRYFRFLAEARLARREAAFWNYHREGLATIGESLKPTSLAGPMIAVLARSILPPGLVNALRSVKRVL
jgi:glycosyltransferase involved in cell wall biosynthesis